MRAYICASDLSRRIIVALTSFGHKNQGTGPGYAYRADILDTQLFVLDQILLREELEQLEE